MIILFSFGRAENRFTYSDQLTGSWKVRITHEWVERSLSRPHAAPGPIFPADIGQTEGTDIVFQRQPPRTPHCSPGCPPRLATPARRHADAPADSRAARGQLRSDNVLLRAYSGQAKDRSGDQQRTVDGAKMDTASV